MALRKHKNALDEIIIFDAGVIYKRGDIWQFRIWLTKDQKYVRKSLETSNTEVAKDKAKDMYLQHYTDQKARKSAFCLTVEKGVKRYLDYRKSDVAGGHIVAGRLVTIRSHLLHCQDFIGKNRKLSELTMASCEDYCTHRVTKSKVPGKQVTIENEQVR